MNKSNFSKAKIGENTRFSGKFISLPIENSWKVWSKLKSGIRILWSFNGSAEGGRKKNGKRQITFILNQRCIENPAKSLWIFLQKSSIVDIWYGSEYASNSEYAMVKPRSYYSLSIMILLGYTECWMTWTIVNL